MDDHMSVSGTEVKLPIPDEEFYRPTFSPWVGYGEFRGIHERISGSSLVTADRCYVLYCLAKQAVHLPGEFWECGVYKGGTASLLAEVLFRQNRFPLRLFDTFAGMPATDPSLDTHGQGDFDDTSVGAVRSQVGHDDLVSYHQGLIPDTFRGLEKTTICFAHVDVDIHRSVMDCCAFIYPRLVKGGFIVFDDYGFASCPGARAAVDQFFQGTGVVPLVLPTGQAMVFKSFP
jgi:O-methyltransferase